MFHVAYLYKVFTIVDITSNVFRVAFPLVPPDVHVSVGQMRIFAHANPVPVEILVLLRSGLLFQQMVSLILGPGMPQCLFADVREYSCEAT
jgi:hypothetical protein